MLGLISCLSQDVTWEWKAYLELHRRAILDWKVAGPDVDYPVGGIHALQMADNESLLGAYDACWRLHAGHHGTVMGIGRS